MKINQETIDRLVRLRARRKYTDSDWEKRGLQPSATEVVDELIKLTDQCLDELLVVVQSNPSKQRVRSTLVAGLKRFKRNNFDTEEREFICDEIQKISKVVGVNISNDLNNWLYGIILGSIIRLIRKKEEIVDVKMLPCTKCELPLTIKVNSIRPGVPGFWIIGQCDQCDEYNLLETGENVGDSSFENFTSIEIFSSSDTTIEQVKTRLDQIRYFRGK